MCTQAPYSCNVMPNVINFYKITADIHNATGCLPSLEDIYIYRSYEVCCLHGCFVYHILSCSSGSILLIIVYMVVCFVYFCLIL
jgi:hypothetical protein